MAVTEVGKIEWLVRGSWNVVGRDKDGVFRWMWKCGYGKSCAVLDLEIGLTKCPSWGGDFEIGRRAYNNFQL